MNDYNHVNILITKYSSLVKNTFCKIYIQNKCFLYTCQQEKITSYLIKIEFTIFLSKEISDFKNLIWFYSIYCIIEPASSAYSVRGGQEHIRFRSPYALSTRPTGAQNFEARV